MQEAISEKARELWYEALNSIDGAVYSHKWEYLEYLEKMMYRKVSTLTLQQVKEPILSFEEFNEMKERKNVMHVESVESVQNVVVDEETEEIIAVQPMSTEKLEIQEISRPKPIVEAVADVEPVIERPLTIEERVRVISSEIRKNYGRYDKVPVKVKAELFQYSIDDSQADMKLHSLVLKELNVKCIVRNCMMIIRVLWIRRIRKS